MEKFVINHGYECMYVLNKCKVSTVAAGCLPHHRDTVRGADSLCLPTMGLRVLDGLLLLRRDVVRHPLHRHPGARPREHPVSIQPIN